LHNCKEEVQIPQSKAPGDLVVRAQLLRHRELPISIKEMREFLYNRCRLNFPKKSPSSRRATLCNYPAWLRPCSPPWRPCSPNRLTRPDLKPKQRELSSACLRAVVVIRWRGFWRSKSGDHKG